MRQTSNKLRIGVVGPSWPFRGGIAKFTTELAKNLSREGYLKCFISVSKQYPQFLFPGKSDKDENSCRKVDLAKPIYSYYEPWTWRRVIREIDKSDLDCVIAPYWSSASAPFLSYLARKSSRPVIPIIHNFLDHDSVIKSPKLSEWALKRATAFVHHNPEFSNLEFFRRQSNKVLFKAHPVTSVRNSSLRLSRMKLKIPEGLTCFLFFGLIRPYKGLDVLLDAMELLPSDAPVAFLIAGEPWTKRKHYERRLRKLSDKFFIHSKLEWIPEQETACWFSAADAIVCPYLKATGSGVVSQALAFQRPVLTTDTGSMSYVIHEGKTGLLSEPGSAKALARNIELFLSPKVRKKLESGIKEASGFTWKSYVDSLVDLAERSIGSNNREGSLLN